MKAFESRESRLWMGALACWVAIYASLPFAGAWARRLRAEGLTEALFFTAFIVSVVTILAFGWIRRARATEVWVWVAVIVVYGAVLVRAFATPEERTHLFEYGLLSVLVYRALLEGVRNGRRIAAPGLITILCVGLIGWLDEVIQAFLPGRTYDLRDVAFNALAATMAVLSTAALQWARRRKDASEPLPPRR